MNSDRFKFRVWSQKYNMYLKDRTYPVGDSNFYISQDGEIVEDYGPVDEWDENPLNRFDNPDYIIEQCTGIYDCAGNPIFEGDVVKTVTGASGPVVWSGGRAGFVVRLTGVCCSLADTQKIVGNVHTR